MARCPICGARHASTAEVEALLRSLPANLAEQTADARHPRLRWALFDSLDADDELDWVVRGWQKHHKALRDLMRGGIRLVRVNGRLMPFGSDDQPLQDTREREPSGPVVVRRLTEDERKRLNSPKVRGIPAPIDHDLTGISLFQAIYADRRLPTLGAHDPLPRRPRGPIVADDTSFNARQRGRLLSEERRHLSTLAEKRKPEAASA